MANTNLNAKPTERKRGNAAFARIGGIYVPHSAWAMPVELQELSRFFVIVRTRLGTVALFDRATGQGVGPHYRWRLRPETFAALAEWEAM